MTIRKSVRIVSFLLATILILLAYAVINMTYANSYKLQLESSYRQSLNELSENLDSIQTNLTKSVYSNSDKLLMEISADLYAECTQAKESLSRLPVRQMNLGGTYKFLSQASDYANYVAKKISSGKRLTDEEHRNLSTLLNYSQKLNESVASMVEISNNGAMITSSKVRSNESFDMNLLTNDMTTAERSFKNYPTLLYDGPFADSNLNRESQLLKNGEKISQGQAQELATKSIDCNPNQLTFENEENGNLPCYTFTCGRKTILVTKRGGYIAQMLYGGKVNKSVISHENAVNLGREYLKKLGYDNMKETYYMTDNNVCTINFAYTKSNITYYSDLIKVGVSMLDGKIISLEADAYLTNHIDRKPFRESEKIATAQAKISPYLEVIDSRKCVIPLDNGLESDCYEFHCISSETGDEALVYINSQTLDEESIMLLLYSDGGTLTK